MFSEIHLQVVSEDMQRYRTSGDWIPSNGLSPHRIIASELGNDDYEFLVLLHELVEFWLCRKRGITDAVVTAFDVAHVGEEPGDDPGAPYHREHRFASVIEHLMAHELGIDWSDYERAFDR